jgi:hypothetical protein
VVICHLALACASTRYTVLTSFALVFGVELVSITSRIPSRSRHRMSVPSGMSRWIGSRRTRSNASCYNHLVDLAPLGLAAREKQGATGKNAARYNRVRAHSIMAGQCLPQPEDLMFVPITGAIASAASPVRVNTLV